MTKKLKQINNEGLINATNLLRALSIENKLLNENNIKQIIGSLKINKKSKVYHGILQIPDKLKAIKSNLEQIESFKNINKNPKLELKINTPKEIEEAKDKISHIYDTLIDMGEEVIDFYNKLNTKNYVNFSKKNYVNTNKENNDIVHLMSQLLNLKLCVSAHEKQLKLESDKIQQLAIKKKSSAKKTDQKKLITIETDHGKPLEIKTDKKLVDAANLLNALTINGEILDEDNIKQIIASLKIHRKSKIYHGILQIPDKIKAIKSELEKTTLIKDINKNPKLELKINTPEEIKETKDKLSYIHTSLFILNATGNGSNTFNDQIKDLIEQLPSLSLSIYAHKNQLKTEAIQNRPLPITPRNKQSLSQKHRSQSLSLLTSLKKEESLTNSNPQLSKSDQALNKTTSSLTLSPKAPSKYLPYIPKYTSSSLSTLSSLPSSEYIPPYSPSSTLSSGLLSTSSSTLWSKASSKHSPQPSEIPTKNSHDQLYAHDPLEDDYRHKAINALDPENEYAYEAEAESAYESASELKLEPEKYRNRYKKTKTSESAFESKPEPKSKTKSKPWSMTLRKETKQLSKKLKEDLYSDPESTETTKLKTSKSKLKPKSKPWSMMLRKETKPLHKKLKEDLYSDLESTETTKLKTSIDSLSASYTKKIRQQKDNKSNRDINI